MAWEPDYATAAELKAYLRVADAIDDTQVALAISSASRAVDQHTNRQFGVVAAGTARVYSARWDRERGRWVVPIDDLMSTAGLTVVVAAGAVDLYTLEPRNAAADGRPWTRLVVDPLAASQPVGDEYEFTITGLWGWTAVPAKIKQATLLQASRILMRRDAPFGISGSPGVQGELRLLAKVDPDVAVLLAGYGRHRRTG